MFVHRFVQGMIGHYYKSDSDVQKDSDLQNWIKDIFIHGFLSRVSSGNTVQSTIVKFIKLMMNNTLNCVT